MQMIPPAMLLILKKWWPVIAAAALFGLLLTLAYCSGEDAGKSGEVVKQQEREIETQRDLNTAGENASAARVKDAVEAIQQEKELTDAIEATDDPDARRALRGCVILRQQGRNLADVPACRRFASED
jgi:hypothetical protein